MRITGAMKHGAYPGTRGSKRIRRLQVADHGSGNSTRRPHQCPIAGLQQTAANKSAGTSDQCRRASADFFCCSIFGMHEFKQEWAGLLRSNR